VCSYHGILRVQREKRSAHSTVELYDGEYDGDMKEIDSDSSPYSYSLEGAVGKFEKA